LYQDSFLSLGVERFKPSGKLRLSYVLWQENNIVPQWVLEVVSKTPGGEYDEKMTKYAQLGVLYYVIYNPDYYRRDQHDSFEVYRLENGVYVRQMSSLVWMPEIGLGIGCEVGTHEGYMREWLYWYDQNGNRLIPPEEIIRQERQRAERLAERLRRWELTPILCRNGISLTVCFAIAQQQFMSAIASGSIPVQVERRAFANAYALFSTSASVVEAIALNFLIPLAITCLLNPYQAFPKIHHSLYREIDTKKFLRCLGNIHSLF
jgi:hypothetical protein